MGTDKFILGYINILFLGFNYEIKLFSPCKLLAMQYTCMIVVVLYLKSQFPDDIVVLYLRTSTADRWHIASPHSNLTGTISSTCSCCRPSLTQSKATNTAVGSHRPERVRWCRRESNQPIGRKDQIRARNDCTKNISMTLAL